MLAVASFLLNPLSHICYLQIPAQSVEQARIQNILIDYAQ